MIFGLPRFKTQRSFNESHALHLNKRFQSRYVTLLTVSLLTSSAVFLFTAFYFTQQNQEIFRGLAFDIYPEMVKHIERESSWLLILLGMTLAATGFSTMWIAKRMTSHLIKPLVAMEKHMRHLISGEWEKSGYRFSESKDFKDLSITYDYLLSTLKSVTEEELELLMRMRLDPHDKESSYLWSELVNQKRKRLGLLPVNPSNLHRTHAKNDAESDVKPHLRRVS
jgi:hypothetical protein